MKGRNELRLCGAEMIRALQMYADKQFLGDKDAPRVTDVREDKGNGQFVVVLDEPKKGKGE